MPRRLLVAFLTVALVSQSVNLPVLAAGLTEGTGLETIEDSSLASNTAADQGSAAPAEQQIPVTESETPVQQEVESIPAPAAEAQTQEVVTEPATPQQPVNQAPAAPVQDTTATVVLQLGKSTLSYNNQTYGEANASMDVPAASELKFGVAAQDGFDLVSVKQVVNSVEIVLQPGQDNLYTIAADSVADGLTIKVETAATPAPVEETPALEEPATPEEPAGPATDPAEDTEPGEEVVDETTEGEDATEEDAPEEESDEDADLSNIKLNSIQSANSTTLTVSPTNATINVGETTQLTAEPARWQNDIRWTSSDNDIATVDANGRVTAKAAGVATITAIADGKGPNGEALTATSRIYVQKSGTQTVQAYFYFALPGKSSTSTDANDYMYAGDGTIAIPDGFDRTTNNSRWYNGDWHNDSRFNLDSYVVEPPTDAEIRKGLETYYNGQNGRDQYDPSWTYTIEWTTMVGNTDSVGYDYQNLNPFTIPHVDCRITVNTETTVTLAYEVRQPDGSLVTNSTVHGKDDTVQLNSTVSTTNQFTTDGYQYDATKRVNGITYYFDGWYTDSSYTTKAADAIDSVNESDVFYARYVAEKHTLTFDANDGQYADQSTKKTAEYVYRDWVDLDAAEQPTRGEDDEWEFVGWSTEKDGDVIDEYYMPDRDATLYAQWKRVGKGILSYNVALDKVTWTGANNPDGLVVHRQTAAGYDVYRDADVYYAKGDSFVVTTGIPQADDHVFIAWFNKEREEDDVMLSKAQFLQGGDSGEYVYEPGEDGEAPELTLDAIWAKLNVTGGTYTYDGTGRQVSATPEYSKTLDEQYLDQIEKLAGIEFGAKTYQQVDEDGAPVKDFGSENPTFVNAGTYYVKVTQQVTVKGTTSTISGTGKIVINPRTVNASQSITKTYDGDDLLEADVTLDLEQAVAGSTTGVIDADKDKLGIEGIGKDEIRYSTAAVHSDADVKVVEKGKTLEDLVSLTGDDTTRGNYVLGDVTVKGSITGVAADDYQASVSIDDWKYGEAASDPTSQITPSHDGKVTYYYKTRGADDSTYTQTKPVNAGSYTVKAVWEQTKNCPEISATDDFQITKRDITFTGKSDSKAYNGEVQTITGYDTTGDGLASTDKIDTLDASASGLTPGGHEGTITPAAQVAIVNDQDENVSANYNITTKPGTLTITASERTITVKADDASKTYDGTALTKETASIQGDVKLFEGDHLEYTVQGSATNVNDEGTNQLTEVKVYRDIDGVKTDVTSGYQEIVKQDGKLTITPRAITISAEAEYAYDGSSRELEVTAEDITSGSLANGEALTLSGYKLTGVGAGTYNEFPEGASWSVAKTAGGEAVDSANYDITITGELTITKANIDGAENLDAHVTMGDWMYGEAAETASAWVTIHGTDPVKTATIDNQPKIEYAAGENPSDDAVWTETKPENAGTYTVRATWEETDNHAELVATDTFTISQRPVTIMGEGWQTTQPYTGEAYTTEKFKVEEQGDKKGLLTGQTTPGLTYKLTGTDVSDKPYVGTFYVNGTEITSGADVVIVDGDEDVSANYIVTLEPGELTIVAGEGAAKNITLNPADAEKVYDTTALQAKAATAEDSKGNEVVIEYTTDNPNTVEKPEWVTDPAQLTRTEVGETTVYVRATVPGVYTDYKYGAQTITVTPRDVEIQVADDDKVYGNPDPEFADASIVIDTTDGTQQVDALEAKLANINLDVHRTDAGNDEVKVHEGVLTITPTVDGLESTYANFNFTIISGNFTITTNETAMTVEGVGYEAPYDGSTHGVSAVVKINGEVTTKATVSFYNEETEEWESASPTWTNFTDGEQTVKIKAELYGYQTVETTATVNITKRDVALTSASLSKAYDGTALTNANAGDTNVTASGALNENGLITETGWVTGEGATYKFTGAQTTPNEPGNKLNVFTIDYNEGTLETNYNVTAAYGDLTVTALPEGELIETSITANSGSKTYDGTPLTVSGFEGQEQDGTIEFTYNGKTFTISGVTSTATETNATVENGEVVAKEIPVTGTPKVTDENNNDVTDQFEVTVNKGTIKVDTRVVYVRADSASKPYDGSPLTDDGWKVLEATEGSDTEAPTGLVGDDKIVNATVTGSVTYPDEGTVANVPSAAQFAEGVVTSNYKVQYLNGELKITDRGTDEAPKYQITAQAPDLTDVYDGTAKTAEGVAFDQLTFDGVTYTVEGLSASRTETNAATYEVPITGTAQVTVTVDGTVHDVTDQFTVDTDDMGELVIQQRPLTITGDGYDEPQVYTGEAYTKTTYQVEPEDGDRGLVTGHALNAEQLTYLLTGTDVQDAPYKGSFGGTLVITDADGASVTDNYAITRTAGELVIKAQSITPGEDPDPDPDYLGVKISDPADVTYNGQRQQSPVTVTTEDEAKTLVSGKDYDIEYQDDVNAGTATVTITGKGNYQGVVERTYTIDKAIALITVNNSSKNYGEQDPEGYNGQVVTIKGTEGAPLYNNVLNDSKQDVLGDIVISRTNATVNDARVYEDVLDATVVEGTLNLNYTYEVETGDFTIVPGTDNYVNIVNASDLTKVYDSEEISVEAEAYRENSTLWYSTDEGETWTEDNPAYENAGTYKVLVKATNPNYEETDPVEATIVISKRPVAFEGEVATKTYTGEAITLNSLTVTETSEDAGLVKGHDHNVTATASGTDARVEPYEGTITALDDVEITEGSVDVTDNYDVTVKPGSLTITPDTTEVVIAVTGNRASYVYDGGEKTVSGYKIAIPDDTTITVDDITCADQATVTKTEVGQYAMGLAADDFACANGNYSNVTFEVTDGELVIVPQSIDPGTEDDPTPEWPDTDEPIDPEPENPDTPYYVGATVTWPEDVYYNGVDQKQDDVVVTVKGEDGADVVLTPTVDYTLSYPSDDYTNVDTVKVTVTMINDNYAGELTGSYQILPRELTISTPDASKVFDGTPLETADDDYTVSGLQDDDQVAVDVYGSQTAVGVSVNHAKIDEFINTPASNYNVSYDQGALTVYPQSIDPTDPDPDNPEPGDPDPENPDPDNPVDPDQPFYTGAEVNSPSDVVYDGAEHQWSPTVTDAEGNVLIEGEDYTVTYVDADGNVKTDFTNVTGAINVIITGQGDYSGQVERTYRITPLEIVVTADNQTKVAGTADPALTSTHSPAVDGEVPGWDGSITRDAGEAVGTYAITQGDLTLADNAETGFMASNYALRFVPGTLTITAAPAGPDGGDGGDGGATPTPTPTPAPTPVPAPTPAPAATDDGITADDGAEDAATTDTAAEETIDDDATPLAVPEHAVRECWVHWLILIGMIASAVYYVGASLRRNRFSADLAHYEKLVLGDDDQNQA